MQNLHDYESVPVNAVAQTYKLTKIVSQKLQQNSEALAHTKIMAAFADPDDVIDLDGSRDFIKKYASHKDSKTYSYKYQDLNNNIISMSHLSLLHKEQNERYGFNGYHRVCSHYHNSEKKYKLCKTSNDIYLGEITDESKDKYSIIVPLTYNPMFDQLLDDIKAFID
ncbi:MAG: hypothetical protein AAF153_01380 [Pseudomonadota bacterium]